MTIQSRRCTATIALILAIACTAEDRHASAPAGFTVQDASNLLVAYTHALTTGDTAQISSFWSQESLAREGFWLMHSWVGGRLEVAEWREFLRDVDFEVTGVQREDRYHIIYLNWLSKASDQEDADAVRSMVYYVVWEDEGWKLSNPIDVLTAEWSSRETECFLYHYPPGMDLEVHLPELEEMDRECGRALASLGLELGEKVEFYRTRTPTEVGRLLTQPPAHGLAAVSYRQARGGPRGFPLVVSATFLHPHEVMHVFQALAGIDEVNAAITEGFAVALGGGAVSTAALAVMETRHLLGTIRYVPLRDLLSMPTDEFLRTNYVTYFEAGAFVKYLIERHGLERFRTMANRTTSPERLETTISSVYGRTIEELEAEWHAFLLQQEFPRSRSTVPPDASLLFSMADPVGDDVGDGDYAYPNARFQEGVFDLTGFDVFVDGTDVYFRLGFRNTMEPVAYSPGSEQFVPGTVIAIKRGAAGDRPLRGFAHGVRFGQGSGYDVAVNVGTAVSLSDNFGRVYFTTGDVRNHIVDLASNTVEFSLPIEFLGSPQDDWEYFVGVGLATDRSMTFLYGGPAPVHREHPVYITGGNFATGNPAFMDILLPEAVDQVEVLGDYDADSGRLAVVPMVRSGGNPRR
jgi:hypothetical protein